MDENKLGIAKEENMQIDMHFYGVYALCRAAGIKDKTAETIAYASQFVDDAIDAEAVVLSDGRGLLPTMTSHRPIDYQNTLPGDQWRVWIPFHFLPGNTTTSTEDINSKEIFTEKLVCREDSQLAKKILKYALAKKNKALWPHLIGIVAHVFADTFSHNGFLGIANSWNKVKSESIKITGNHHSSVLHYIWSKFEEFKTRFTSDFAELVPVGHAAVATFPDRPYLKWRFQYETHEGGAETVERDNPSIFLRACRGLYAFFSQVAEVWPEARDPQGPMEFDKIEGILKTLIGFEAPKEDRIGKWKKAIGKGKFNRVTSIDKQIHYNNGLWRPRRVEYQREPDTTVETTDTYRFMRAAHEYRRYVLLELLPTANILV